LIRRKAERAPEGAVRGEHVLRALCEDRPLLRRVADMKHVLKFSTAEQPDVKGATRTRRRSCLVRWLISPSPNKRDWLKRRRRASTRRRLCSRALLAMDASGALLRFCLGGGDTGATSDAVTRERQLRLAAKAARMDTGEFLALRRGAPGRHVHIS